MGKRPTMVDIAMLAGVSQATVSLVLNEVANARVSAETRARVMATARDVGYPSRRTLSRPVGARVIGLLIDELSTTPFAPPLLDGARDEAATQGCLVSVFCTNGDPATERAALDVLRQIGVLGVLYSTLITRTVAPPAGLAAFDTILLNCHDADQRFPSVIPADTAGGFAAVSALVAAGHRRIAHLGGEDWGEAAQARADGYRRALAAAGIALDPDLLAGPAWTVGSGRDETLRLLDLPDPPTAFFCFNDRVAIGCYEALNARGLRVPDDISVVGFDNEDLVGYLSPPLSTMILPHDEMARAAVGMLMETRPLPPRQITVDCAFVERRSIGAPKRRI